MKKIILIVMLHFNQCYAKAISIVQVNCQKNYAEKIAEIFEQKYQIPHALITLSCVENCQGEYENKKPVHLCLNNLDELVIINWNAKFVEKSLAIFKSIKQRN